MPIFLTKPAIRIDLVILLVNSGTIVSTIVHWKNLLLVEEFVTMGWKQ